MSRDSLFGETIHWSGRPTAVPISTRVRLVMAMSAAFALTALGFATVLSTALHVSVSGLIFFAAWCSAVGLFSYCWPGFWWARVEYAITDRHVIWRRGPIRRSIDRDSVSYAVVRWNPRAHGIGDLVLVRAVPTGALRRTLRLTLSNIVAPDRVGAIVRGVKPGTSLGDGDRPLPQRLDEGERVLWSGTPALAPWTIHRLATAAVAVGVALAAVRLVVRAVPTLRRVAHFHALPGWSFVLFLVAIALAFLFVAAVAVWVGYAACVQPGRLARATRYLVTNQRVLIRRGREELSLERHRIADVISAPTRAGAPALVDLFLILDGPHARAFASSGAFRHAQTGNLLPVLLAIEDAETALAVLRRVVVADPLATAA